MITTKHRAQLRGLANSAETIVQIGKSGITDAVISSVNDALTARELVKGKVLETCDYTPREICEALCEACSADPVQVIGTKFVIFRRNTKAPKIALVKSKK